MASKNIVQLLDNDRWYDLPMVQDSSKQQILSAQLRLLYANANLGVGVTIVAATILAGLQWGIIARSVVVGWLLYMTLVSVFRYAIARRYGVALPAADETNKWRTVFTVGVGLTSAGWGAAGIPCTRRPTSQTRFFSSSFSAE